MKALVADDSAVMRKVMTGVLGQCGFLSVVHAHDGKQAVEWAGQEEFDLVIMDWDLPIMSGMDAVRTMRSQGRTMPIIMLAAEADQHRVLEALKSGATNFIIKPFEPATVMAKVKAVLGAAGAGASPA
jgi:two-component system chemotaxis response regulator CheY